MPRLWMVALLLGLAACEDEASDRPSRHDCEAVLAHLTVLEGPAVDAWAMPDRTMCKYHPSCEGSERKRFMEMCPQVLSRRELRCYQRATSLGLADACLPRRELDARIMSGEAGRGGQGYGGGSGPAWLGLGARGGEPRRDTAPVPPDLNFAFPEPTHGSVSGIPDCDEYIAVMEKYVMCDQIPHSMRDSTRDSIREMADAWRSMSTMDDATRRMAGDACRQAITSVRDAASTMGCRI